MGTTLEGREGEGSSVVSRSLIVTPTFNESQSLQTFVEELLVVAEGAHILIVDDNSPDGTGDIADALAETHDSVFVLHRPAKLGLGTAYLEGFAWGLGRGYDFFFEMDADGSHKPEHLPLFFEQLEKGVDLVIGSRNIEGGSIVGWGPFRYLLSKGGSLYARTILGLGVRDLTSGFKAFRRDCLCRLELETIKSAGYAFQIELTHRAALLGCSIVEVPICFEDRTVGKSKMDSAVFREAVVSVWRFRAGATNWGNKRS